MNIFEQYLATIKELIIKNAKKLEIDNINALDSVTIEIPPDKFDYDLSCNIAMVLAKANKKKPELLARNIQSLLLNDLKSFSKIDIAGPGFLNINFKNEALTNLINKILKEKANYGSNLKDNKYNLEFVSANPTGPMHVGHCRGAIFGDVLANLLIFNGNKVTKEYYVNDHGNQIKNFIESVFLRLREIKFDEKFKNKKELYPGEYVKDIAKKIIETKPSLNLENLKNIYADLHKLSITFSLDMIKSDLNKLGISHDIFVFESELIKNKTVEKAVNKLKDSNFVAEGYLEAPKGEENKNWKKIKRLIFKSSIFGDDTDRALQKNDGSWTYFASDVGYHSFKISRKFKSLINILGADHTGYIKRINAAVNALSENKVTLNCKVCQLVKLFKKGKPYKMSKRAGDFISVRDLLSEVDKDSIRFMMLSRSNDVELDFDFSKVLEKNKDNQVFYVQYCYARINSLFRNLKFDLNNNFEVDQKNFDLNLYERKILRKIFDWTKTVDIASFKQEPHRITFYLYDLATLFHSYWSKGNENEKFKLVKDGKIKNFNSLIIIKLVAIVIENGMKILGVSLPTKM
tara:strand:- start:1614 stop:3338 length:1725 start_codon:yes stop_codon:yes gene_type:complete